jgi:hypothetical protein
MSESWKTAGVDAAAADALFHRLPASQLWSLLLKVMEARARRPAPHIVAQWERDGFTAPAAADQRLLVELDRALLAAAPQFEAIELSPLAPLGACSAIALTSQNRVVSALRGCEVVSDPTNVMALECARRLKPSGTGLVRLATAHRCVRAQPFPRLPGFAAHFRIFCLASGTAKGADHDSQLAAFVEHVEVQFRALEAVRHAGIDCPDPTVTLFATPERAGLADRIASAVGRDVIRRELTHRYYDGLRFTITARNRSGDEIPIVDGGAFDWLARLTGNRKLTFIASGLGTQLLATQFRRTLTLG